MKIIVGPAFILSILLGSLASAVTPANWEDRRPETYEVQNPPKSGSKEEQKDYEILHQLQDSRSQQDCEMARIARYPDFRIFWEVLFPRYVDKVGEKSPFSAEDIQEFKPFISRVMKQADDVTDFFKSKYRRLRPYDQDPTLTPCAFKPGGRKSYPSSHTSKAFAAACVLADQYPTAKDLLMDFAQYMGDLRVLGGVHHPSDVEAGKSIGLQICEDVLQEH